MNFIMIVFEKLLFLNPVLIIIFFNLPFLSILHPNYIHLFFIFFKKKIYFSFYIIKFIILAINEFIF